MTGNTILLALKGLRRNKMRSFLTILGVVIGVSAVVTMVTLGNGTTRSVSQQIASLGSNLIRSRRVSAAGPGLLARRRRRSRSPMQTPSNSS
jgi:putative ABC transport system permease protein